MSINISELVNLIEACGKAGVKKLVHETKDGLPINLEFFQQINNPVPEIRYIDPPADTSQISKAPENDVSMEVSHDFNRQEELRLLEEDFDLLPIADPERYEELLANGKLDHFGEAHA